LQFIQNGTTTMYRIDDVVLSYTNTSPLISASGPTSFCPGGSVILNSSPGSSYLWSNGSTTQQITVNSGGDYFVTETSLNGCIATSNIIPVSVPHALYDSIVPNSGMPGSTVDLYGNNFNRITNLYFNGTPATFNLLTNNHLTTTVPVNATTGNITSLDTCGTATAGIFTVLPFMQPVQVHAFIQGFYTGSGLQQSVADPIAQPSICDTIEIGIATPPHTVLSTIKTALSVSGNTNVTFPGLIYNQSYFLFIKHRNSLETWSATSFTATGTNVLLDFTSSTASAFGNRLADLGDGSFAIFSGDLNQDGMIDLTDLSLLENASANFGYGYFPEDVTGDWLTESADYSLLENNIVLSLSVARP